MKLRIIPSNQVKTAVLLPDMQSVQQLWEDGSNGRIHSSVFQSVDFVLILVQLVKSEGISNTVVAVSPKISFLLNERIYTKLTSERDQFWAIHALEAAAMTALTEMETAWPIATIFFIANPKLSRKVRSTARTMLENVVGAMTPEHREKCAGIVIVGIEEWLRQFSVQRKDSPAMMVGVSSLNLLRDVVHSILPEKLAEETSYVNHVLIRIFVLAHHPKLPRHQWSWIDIVRKANVDPGQLTAAHIDEFMSVLAQKWGPAEKVRRNLAYLISRIWTFDAQPFQPAGL